MIRRYLSGVQHRPDRSATWHDRHPPVRIGTHGVESRSSGWLPPWLPVTASSLAESVGRLVTVCKVNEGAQ